MTEILFMINEVGDSCVTKIDGKEIYDLIKKFILLNEKIILDFSGVLYFSSSFFYNSVGKLIVEFGKEKVDELLIINHLNDDGKRSLEIALTGVKIFGSDQKCKKIIDGIMNV